MHHLNSYFFKEVYLNLKNLNEIKTRLTDDGFFFLDFVLKKMGISLDSFIKRCYEKDPNGEWAEYGENAIKLKWIDYIVNDVKMTSINKKYSDVISNK